MNGSLMFLPPSNLNDYYNLSPIGEDKGRACFNAVQTGTNREVILEILIPEYRSQSMEQEFREEIRVKASVNCPYVCNVYEAGEEGNFLYFSREKHRGISIEEKKANKDPFTSGDLLLILSILSQTALYFEEKKINTEPLSLKNIYISPEGISILNPAIPGERNPTTSRDDLIRMGEELRELISPGTPGSTRLTTIFKTMIDGHLGASIGWNQVEDMVLIVKDQLGENQGGSTKLISVSNKKNSKKWLPWILGGTVAAILTVLSAFLLSDNAPRQPKQIIKPKHKAPSFQNRDHYLITTSIGTPPKSLQCDAHEVTISAYSRFLNSLVNMPPSGKKAFDHPDQPQTKKNHIPDDWENMVAAAQKNKTWRGRPMSMRTPVVNVDFWDACAYANWKGHRLPSKEEWAEITKNIDLNGKSDPFGSVDKYDMDVDSRGFCGFSSGVQEWTTTKERNIAHPAAPPQRVVCGGSSTTPGYSIIHYMESSEMRSPELGFRTIKN